MMDATSTTADPTPPELDMATTCFSSMPTETILTIITYTPYEPTTLSNLSLVNRQINGLMKNSKRQLLHDIVKTQFFEANSLRDSEAEYTMKSMKELKSKTKVIEGIIRLMLHTPTLKWLKRAPKEVLARLCVGLHIFYYLNSLPIHPATVTTAALCLSLLPAEVLSTVRFASVQISSMLREEIAGAHDGNDRQGLLSEPVAVLGIEDSLMSCGMSQVGHFFELTDQPPSTCELCRHLQLP